VTVRRIVRAVAVPVQVVFDCADPAAEARFWAAALGYQEQPPPPGYDTWQDWLREQGIPESQWNMANAVIDPDGVGPRLFFQQVTDRAPAKTPVHLDLNVGGGPSVPLDERRVRVDAEAERLVALGASRVRAYEQRGEYWVAMRDPEGIEFDLQ
jgi:hypothetical protein